MTSWAGRTVRTVSAALAAGSVVVVGVWVTGGVVTDDATTAKILTGAWLGVSGALAVLVARSRRVPAFAVLAGWFVTTSLTGGNLLLTSTVDRVVHERVVVAESVPDPAAAPRTRSTAVRVASGRFRSGAHETRGLASLVRTADGRRVLTLTGFSTAPGPDLRVYVVPSRLGVDHAVDLGRLKGNKGDQQYVVPPGATAGSVVIWCRAFSVRFGSAVLRAPSSSQVIAP